MNKIEFVKVLKDKVNEISPNEEHYTTKSTEYFLQALNEVVFDTMEKNDYCPFTFGKIGGKEVDAKTARNPKTGDKIQVAAKSGYPYAKFSAKAKGKE